jgi:hypothetical protein
MDYIINSLTTSRLSIRHLSRARSLGRRHQVCALAHGASPWVVSLPRSGRTRRRCVALGMAPLMGGSQGFPLVLGGEGVDADRHCWERQPPIPDGRVLARELTRVPTLIKQLRVLTRTPREGAAPFCVQFIKLIPYKLKWKFHGLDRRR